MTSNAASDRLPHREKPREGLGANVRQGRTPDGHREHVVGALRRRARSPAGLLRGPGGGAGAEGGAGAGRGGEGGQAAAGRPAGRRRAGGRDAPRGRRQVRRPAPLRPARLVRPQPHPAHGRRPGPGALGPALHQDRPERRQELRGRPDRQGLHLPPAQGHEVVGRQAVHRRRRPLQRRGPRAQRRLRADARRATRPAASR